MLRKNIKKDLRCLKMYIKLDILKNFQHFVKQVI